MGEGIRKKCLYGHFFVGAKCVIWGSMYIYRRGMRIFTISEIAFIRKTQYNEMQKKILLYPEIPCYARSGFR